MTPIFRFQAFRRSIMLRVDMALFTDILNICLSFCRKVTDSIPEEVIGSFNLPNPSSRNMCLWSTQPPTDMSTRNLPGGKVGPARKADKLTVMCETIVYIMWEPRRITTLWISTACYRDIFTLFFFYIFVVYSIYFYVYPYVDSPKRRFLLSILLVSDPNNLHLHLHVQFSG
jgi:hypothetical protein